MASEAEKHGMLSDGVVALLGLIHADVQAMRVEVSEIRAKQVEGDANLTSHAAREEAEISEIAKGLKSSVPDGDLDAHRRAHEAWIAEKVDRATLYRSVREKVVSGTVITMLSGIAMACWYWIKDHVK